MIISDNPGNEAGSPKHHFDTSAPLDCSPQPNLCGGQLRLSGGAAAAAAFDSAYNHLIPKDRRSELCCCCCCCCCCEWEEEADVDANAEEEEEEEEKEEEEEDVMPPVV